MMDDQSHIAAARNLMRHIYKIWLIFPGGDVGLALNSYRIEMAQYHTLP